MSALALERVSVRRGVGPVISGVDLRLEPGAVTAIIGPNGAGKTSLLEAISGLATAVDGEIVLDGESITKLNKRRRAKLGIAHVEQGRAIFPSLTVREHLELVTRSSADIEQALAYFPELEKRLHSPSVLLSGGEQQMVVLARAFVAKPRYLLIDEMSLGLAPVVFRRLLPVVAEIANSGVGVLLVEQFAGLALRISQDALVFSSGRVTYAGSSASLLADAELLNRAYLGTNRNRNGGPTLH